MSEQKLKMKMKAKGKNLATEVKKELVGSKVLLTSINDIISKLLKIMKAHIGESNQISRNKLFLKVYGVESTELKQLHEWMLWEFIKKAMHRCRQRTKCFIVSKLDVKKRMYMYWVASDMNDYNVYREVIDKNKKAMDKMVERCNRAVIEEWHEDDWEAKDEI